MLRFQHIEYLWLMAFIPILILLFVFLKYNRVKQLKKLGSLHLVEAQMPGYHKSLLLAKFLLIVFGSFFGIVALANLQSGAKSEKVQRKGIDVMIALDVSKSMLAKDMNPDRLTKAKQMISRLIEKLNNDRVGLVLFAGKAYLSVPLTVDMSALKMNLSTALPSMIPTQGTVIGEAIKMARESFNVKETKYKSIILISDGEDHDESALDEVKKAVEAGIMINTVGVGSENGSEIWDEETKANKKDEKGNEVVSKLNEKELQEIASKGEGIYRRLTQTETTTQDLINQINTIEQKKFGDSLFVNYKSYFQYFLGISFLLFFIEFLLPSRKKITAA